MRNTQKYKDIEALVLEQKDDFLALGKIETLKLYENQRGSIPVYMHDLLFDAIMDLFEKYLEN